MFLWRKGDVPNWRGVGCGNPVVPDVNPPCSGSIPVRNTNSVPKLGYCVVPNVHNYVAPKRELSAVPNTKNKN